MIHKTSRFNTFWLCNTELNLDHILFSYTLELKRGKSDLIELFELLCYHLSWFFGAM